LRVVARVEVLRVEPTTIQVAVEREVYFTQPQLLERPHLQLLLGQEVLSPLLLSLVAMERILLSKIILPLLILPQSVVAVVGILTLTNNILVMVETVALVVAVALAVSAVLELPVKEMLVGLIHLVYLAAVAAVVLAQQEQMELPLAVLAVLD
tara:strand:+ start:486 stop:944 length:459 start_codon:yes stop_codon:yes gene_type:complete